VQYTYRLRVIPDELQGRVNSVFRLVALGSQPLGAALAGVLLQRAGSASTALVFSAVVLMLALLTTANRHVRHAGPPVDLRP
jgi:predicted MFS family arabinose efflux permease